MSSAPATRSTSSRATILRAHLRDTRSFEWRPLHSHCVRSLGVCATIKPAKVGRHPVGKAGHHSCSVRLQPDPIHERNASESLGSMSSFLEFEAVSKNFGSVKAVQNVSLGIRKGEFFSLLGPSGCGKTTLLRMVAGFETPDSGRILIDGQDISHAPAEPPEGQHDLPELCALSTPHRTARTSLSARAWRDGPDGASTKRCRDCWR